MESRVPLPTDNIYKFYALFGLLLLIFGVGSILYVTKSTNDLVFEDGVELATLKANTARSVAEETRFKLLERKLEVALQDKNTLSTGISVIIAFGIVMMVSGFWKWHTKVQPIQDEMAKLSLEKLRQEVERDK
jgi:hypothetical protein